MRSWLQKVMTGRYGVDEFSRFLNILAMVFLVLFMLLNNSLGSFFWLLTMATLIWSFVRILSRNTYRRRAENNAYLTARYNLTRKLSGVRQRMRQKKYYRFYKCPKCGITTRVPKGKGKIRITCPKCGEIFQRKS